MRRSLIPALALVAALGSTALADQSEHVSSLGDQRAVGITIYNSELALVRERRHLTLPRGESYLALRDVSAKIQPETALLTSITAPGRLSVLEQNFNYDLLSPQKLLEKIRRARRRRGQLRPAHRAAPYRARARSRD